MSQPQPVRSDDVIFFPSGEELWLHHIGAGEYYLLTGTAQEVWNLCNGDFADRLQR
jgi:hypothetical protein